VVIGAHTVIAGCTGISGSVTIGRDCMIGGGVGIVGHLSICDGVTISGFSFVTKSIVKPGTYTSGTPAMPHGEWLRNSVHLRHLDEILRRVPKEKQPGDDRE
jgi:UDP-3-O-[3-hydroxymyristoyl] glucosamine N-acyltransferase